MSSSGLGAERRRPRMVHTLLLVCGVASSLLWPLTSEVLAALLYKEYSSFAQTISELTSIGAPTRMPLIAEGFIYEALIIAFGIGVWQSADGNKALRVAGGLLVAYGAVGPLWLPFPMTARTDIATTAAWAFTDVMHIILGAVDAGLYLAILGFGSAAFGNGFRIYSILTLVVVLIFGGWTNSFVPLVAAGEPTPWLGVVERVMIGAFLLWVVVLSVLLLRRSSESGGNLNRGRQPEAYPPPPDKNLGAPRGRFNADLRTSLRAAARVGVRLASRFSHPLIFWVPGSTRRARGRGFG